MARKDMVERAKDAAVARWLWSMDRYESVMGSPIEKAMFWGLLSHCDLVSQDPLCGCEVDLPADLPHPRIYGATGYGEVFVLVPQMTVGRYRLDFALIHLRHAFGKRRSCQPIAIECDGHDFHERTKEQAEHDKERDRELQASGWAVARFTGSEIFRDPAVAAGKVDSMLHRLLGYDDLLGGK
jgi:very-short-patch-repair endonuclease